MTYSLRTLIIFLTFSAVAIAFGQWLLVVMAEFIWFICHNELAIVALIVFGGVAFLIVVERFIHRDQIRRDL